MSASALHLCAPCRSCAKRHSRRSRHTSREAFLKPDLVELVKLDPTIKLDIRYATTNNFLGTPVYTQARAFLQRPAAEALLRAHRELKAQGYGLIIHDGYRPWYVTKIFWDATPDDKKIFVANPAEGSKHNRGCAVDLSLYDLATGKEVKMPSGYDEMSDRAYADYAGGTADERARRDLLRQAMEKQGFTVYPAGVVALRLQGLEPVSNPEREVRRSRKLEISRCSTRTNIVSGSSDQVAVLKGRGFSHTVSAQNQWGLSPDGMLLQADRV